MESYIQISEFKAKCLRILDTIKKTGSSIIVTRKGEPIALVSPPPPKKPQSWLGCLKDEITIKGDIISPAAEHHDWEALKN